jgi:monofunctional biosynthetic peptidoglycan transglycosylase
MAILVGIACYVAQVFFTLPDISALRTSNPASTALMDMRAAEAQQKGIIKRRIQFWVPYEQISPHLKYAVLAAQDATFFSREGIDLGKLLNYVEMNGKEKELTNQGGITLTQQLAKNLYSSSSENQFFKLREFLIVQQLETELSKHRIFEIYLNVIEWGDGIWGAEAAARMYFRIPASKLNREQAALLAAAIANSRLPAIPSKRLLRRQQFILERMDNVELPYSTEGHDML